MYGQRQLGLWELDPFISRKSDYQHQEKNNNTISFVVVEWLKNM